MKSILEIIFGVFNFIVDIRQIRKVSKEEKLGNTKHPFKRYLLQPSMIALYILIILIVTAAFISSYINVNHTLPNRTEKEMSDISNALEDWSKKFGSFPGSLDIIIGQNPLRQEWTKDAWGNSYIYLPDISNNSFVLASLGPDGQTSQDDLFVTNESETK